MVDAPPGGRLISSDEMTRVPNPVTRRRGPGRPPVYRRKAKVSVVFEAAELRTIARAAREAGEAASTWIRQAALARLHATTRKGERRHET